QGLHRCVKGGGRVGDVELINIDALETQALQAAFTGLLNVPRRGIMLPDARTVARPANLGRDDEARGIGMKRLGDQLLGDVGTVGVGGVNEIDTELDSAAQRSDGSGAVLGRA